MAVTSLIRSTILNRVKYLGALAGNTALSNNMSMFHVGGQLANSGITSVMKKMPYLTETITPMPATLTLAISNAATAFANGRNFGYCQSGGGSPYCDKFNLTTEVNASLLFYPARDFNGTYRGGSVIGSAGYYGVGTNSYRHAYATDTVSNFSYLSSFTNIATNSGYTWSAGTNIYFGGGSVGGGSTIRGGLVKLDTTTNTTSSTWGVSTLLRAFTAGAENGSSFGYLAGGWTGTALPTSVAKVNFASDSTYSTLGAVLSTSRMMTRVGQSHTTSAYYISGRASTSSVAAVIQTTDKLTYSSDTMSSISIGTITENNALSYNMQ